MGKVTTFANRLQELLDIKNITKAELSRLAGISKSSLTHYVKGHWEGKQDAVYAIAHATNVDEAWLMGFDVPMYKGTDISPIPPGFEPMPEMMTVPLVGRIACGEPITAEENIEDYVAVPAYWHATFTLRCCGDSMEPTVHDGDLVAIRKETDIINSQIYAVRIDDEATLKHVYLYPDRLELRPENPAHESRILFGEQISTAVIEGRAVGFCRNL